MPRAVKTVPVARAEAKLYLAKANQFLGGAVSALEEGKHDLSMLDSVHAAISSADAVTVAIAGLRSADPDHQRAADLLEQVVGSSAQLRTHVRQLRELLAKKNMVEYESRRTTQKEAIDAQHRAERLVTWAREIVEGATP